MDKEKIIKDYFKKFKKVTTTCVDKFFLQNPEFKNYIENILQNEPEWESIQNVINGIVKDIKLPKCKICGKTLKYSRLQSSYCSFKCKNLDKELFDKIKQTYIDKYGVDNPAKAKEVQDKIKQTNLFKYGCENAAQSDDIKRKTRETNLKKYGVEYTVQAESVKRKIQETFDEKYNGNPNKCKEIRDKIKETCREKYGVDSPFQNEDVIRKAINTRIENGSTRNQLTGVYFWNTVKARKQREKVMLEKYGVLNPMQIPEIKKKIQQTNMKKYGGPTPVFDELIRKKMSDSRHELTYERDLIRFKGIVEPMFTKEEFNGAGYDKVYKWKCCQCGNIFEDHCYSHVPRCMKCKPYATNYSFMELELLNFIKEFYPNAHKDKKLICPKELDCVVDELKLAIEFNGKFWHSIERGKNNGYHLDKVKACNSKGYRLLHIWEDEWIDNPQEVKEKLKNILTKSENLKFDDEIIKLDRSWFNNIDIPGYELIGETLPEITERHLYETENCGYLIYKRIE